MGPPDRFTDHVGGPYPEEILLEAYNLEWKAIDLRHQRLQKTWQQFMMIEEMEKEELRYQRQLHRLKQQEKEEQEAEQEALRREREKERLRAEKQKILELEAEKAEVLRREKERLKAETQKKRLRELEAEKEEALRVKERLKAEKQKKKIRELEVKKEEALRREKEKLKAEKKKKKLRELAAEQEEALRREKKERLKAEKKKKKIVTAQEVALRRGLEKEAALKERKKLKAAKKKKLKQVATSDSQTDEEESAKSKVHTKQAKKTKTKRITPVSLPATMQPEDESFSEENQTELGGYDSPPLELPDDGLVDMFDKGSDSDIDDGPSVVSLILPVAQDSPKRAQPSPSKKKVPTPQKRFAKKGGPSLDFNFSNAEAKRQAKVAKAAARAEQDDNDEADSDSEPEPMPLSISTPKKHLKRRNGAAKAGNAFAGKSLMMAVANSTIAIKPKEGAITGKAKTAAAADGTAKASRGTQGKTKPQMKANSPVDEEENAIAPTVKKKTGGKGGKMTIKQRLANAELLARMSKMQDMNTPKVLGKKTKMAQTKAATKTLAAKHAEFQKDFASDPAEPDAPRRNEDIEDGDLNISLNSSGLMSDNDSPGHVRAPMRKRPREAVDEDVTPTKKLQFLEITKRLTKSPMPRFLRTPTPLMSPVIASSLVKPRAASPAAESRASVDTTAKATRRMNSAPVRPKKTANVNRFGIPGGGANTAASSGGFSMFDAFVNSSGTIPRLKTKTPGNMSP